MTLHPAIAAVRAGVRDALQDLPRPPRVLVACSGGADSLALLSAAVFEVHKVDGEVFGATVDHGLQDRSAEQATRVVQQMAELGVDQTISARVQVEAAGLGVEAAARQARYEVLEQMAEHLQVQVTWLGHTRDDQAETVLMGLARGSGGRSIAGMRRAFDGFARPLLDVSRLQTETACRVQQVDYWSDPHNTDPAYLRARVRQTVLPVLETELGPGIAATLARTADQLREDTEYLDALARDTYLALATQPGTLGVPDLAPLPDPLRRRVLHLAILAAGAPAAEVTRAHVLAVDALVIAWRGQRWIDLPGHLRAIRRDGQIRLAGAESTAEGK